MYSKVFLWCTRSAEKSVHIGVTKFYLAQVEGQPPKIGYKSASDISITIFDKILLQNWQPKYFN